MDYMDVLNIKEKAKTRKPKKCKEFIATRFVSIVSIVISLSALLLRLLK